MTHRKGNLFFTADTLIAVLVIVGTFLMIQSSYSTATQQDDPQQSLIQMSSFFRETTVGNLLEQYPGVYQPPNYNGQEDPWRRDLSLYQEILYLESNGYGTEAAELITNVTTAVGLGDQFSYQFELDGKTVYEKKSTQVNESPAYVTKRVLVYSLNEDGNSVIGPNRSAVSVWI